MAGAVTSQLCEVEVFKYYVEGRSLYSMDPYNNVSSSREGRERDANLGQTCYPAAVKYVN